MICMICKYDMYGKLQGASCPVFAAGEQYIKCGKKSINSKNEMQYLQNYLSPKQESL